MLQTKRGSTERTLLLLLLLGVGVCMTTPSTVDGGRW
jgi:hypothetical protein